MYAKPDASKLRQNFWTAFGQYMAPVPSAEQMNINWINYKTGIKHIRFKMNATNQLASIRVVIDPPDQQTRKLYYEKFVQLRSLFSNLVPGSWQWLENASDENDKVVSKIEISLPGVNVFDQNSWPAIISFLKEKIIALDEFWSYAKDSFEASF